MKRPVRALVDAYGTAQRLREILAEKGMTQKELARRLDTNTSSVSNWFSGKAVPSIVYLLTLSAVLEMPIEDIVVYDMVETEEVPV